MADKSQARCVAVIQCHVAHERCPGVACAGAFARREGYFAGYTPGSLPPSAPASGAAAFGAPSGESPAGASSAGASAAGGASADASAGGAVYYVPFTCGGCPGRRVGRLLSNIKRQVKKRLAVGPEEIIVHLATCVIGDNGHYTPCPFLKDIRTIIARKGLHFVEGSIYKDSPGTEAKRDTGEYAPLPPLDNLT